MPDTVISNQGVVDFTDEIGALFYKENIRIYS